MKAKTTIFWWVLSIALMVLFAVVNEWLILIPFVAFIRLSLYLEKHCCELLSKLYLCYISNNIK